MSFSLWTGHHPNITILRCIPSKDEHVLTIFLEDTTYFTGIYAGFLAVCERVPGEQWFVATVCHEWSLTDYRGRQDDRREASTLPPD